MNSLISVIIPVFKVEEYLDQCVESVIGQTYQNLEIILVDDGSPDNCPAMCDAYAEKDTRIRVIHKANGGLSDARNAGIQIATGEYIGFVDSDDWVDPDMYKTLADAIIDNEADIAEIGLKYCYPNKTEFIQSSVKKVLSKTETSEAFLDRSLMILGCVVGKLYRADIVKAVLFPVGKLHEDGYFTYRALYEAKRYVLLNVCKYNYRQERQGSIMTTTARNNPKSLYDVIGAFEERNAFYGSHNEKVLKEKSEAYYYKTLVSEYQNARRGCYGQDVTKDLGQRIRKLNADILRNQQLGMWRIKYYVFQMFMLPR